MLTRVHNANATAHNLLATAEAEATAETNFAAWRRAQGPRLDVNRVEPSYGLPSPVCEAGGNDHARQM